MGLYIFLDIDGVMVPAKGWKQPELLSDGFPDFSTKAVAALLNLLTSDDIIILTTSHKSTFNLTEWANIFARRGITGVDIQTLPPNEMNRSRKDEILNWFTANPTPEEFIIIDDDTRLNDLPALLKQKLVLTSPYIGLTKERLADANIAMSHKQ